MARRRATEQAWAVGGLVFAATMLIMLGVWQAFVGIAAIANDRFFVVGPNYTYDLDVSAWGWIHLLLGALAVLAGIFLFAGAAWARAVGIAFAALSAINNFVFLPYYPLWSLAVIAIDVFVIWSLATVDTRDRVVSGYPSYSGGAYAGERSQPAPDRWPTNRPTGSRAGSAPGEPAGGPAAPEAAPDPNAPPLGRQ